MKKYEEGSKALRKARKKGTNEYEMLMGEASKILTFATLLYIFIILFASFPARTF